MKIGPMLEPKCVHGKPISRRCGKCTVPSERETQKEAVIGGVILAASTIVTLVFLWLVAMWRVS